MIVTNHEWHPEKLSSLKLFVDSMSQDGDIGLFSSPISDALTQFEAEHGRANDHRFTSMARLVVVSKTDCFDLHLIRRYNAILKLPSQAIILDIRILET